MVTDKGVRAGINPAPTTTSNGFRIGDYSPQFSVKGGQCRGGVHPRPNPAKDIKAMCTGGK